MGRIMTTVFAAALTLAALAGPALAGGGCINESHPADGTDPNVKIANCSFQAAILRVPVGARVTWTNAEQYLPHVVSGIGWGRTQMMQPGDTYSHDFSEAGIYPYTCTLHPGMSAVVLVGEVAAPASHTTTAAAARFEAPAQAPAERTSDAAWLVLTASILVGVSTFAAGRYLSRT